MSASEQVISLNRPDSTAPWGFRLVGGANMGTPLIVQNVNGGSLAEKSGLHMGDVIVRIGGREASAMRHQEALDTIVAAGNALTLTVTAGELTTWAPQVTTQPGGQLKTSLAHQQPASGGLAPKGFNAAAKPFPGSGGGGSGPRPTGSPVGGLPPPPPASATTGLVHKQFNSPMPIYSMNNIKEVIDAHSETIAPGVVGINFMKPDAPVNTESAVYRMVMEEEAGGGPGSRSSTSTGLHPVSMISGGHPTTAPSPIHPHPHHQNQFAQQSSGQPRNLSVTGLVSASSHDRPVSPMQSKLLSQMESQGVNVLGTDSHHHHQQQPQATSGSVPAAGQRPMSSAGSETQQPPPGPPPPTSAPAHQALDDGLDPNVCTECGRLVVGVFVRVKGRSLHPECFRCATCGTSLKNVGHYTVNERLYCELHARQVAVALPGSSAPERVPIQTGGLDPTQAIMGALSSAMDGPLPSRGGGGGPAMSSPTPRSPSAAFASASALSSAATLPRPTTTILPIVSVNSSQADSTFSSSSSSTLPRPKATGFRPVRFNPSAVLQHSQQQPPLLANSHHATVMPTPVGRPVAADTYGRQPAPTSGGPGGQKFAWPPQGGDPPQGGLGGGGGQGFSSEYTSQYQQQQQQQPGGGGRLLMTSSKSSMSSTATYQQSSSSSLPMSSMGSGGPPPPSKVPPATAPKPRMGGGGGGAVIWPIQSRQNPPQVPQQQPQPFRGVSQSPSQVSGGGGRRPGPPGPTGGVAPIRTIPKRGRGTLQGGGGGGIGRIPICASCSIQIRGPFVVAGAKSYCKSHFLCANGSCGRNLIEIGFVEEQGQLYCENCFSSYMAPPCSKCGVKVKGDCLSALDKTWHPDCFACCYCHRPLGTGRFHVEDGQAYCERDWVDLFSSKCIACGFPIEAGDRWVEAINANYHTQCFKCSTCGRPLEGQSFLARGGRPYCKSHGR